MTFEYTGRHVEVTPAIRLHVEEQFKKLEQDLRNHGQVRWKHVMHLIRLLLSGVEVLKHGFVPLIVDQYRDRLLQSISKSRW